tara:strand:+ start:4649 stop:10597 length:5949 start_codon:yes stop_codon:yes gene_type:complete
MQEKKNFQGGLNRDDDSRVLPDGDYFYAQNIRVLTSEDRSGMVLENVRGMSKETHEFVREGDEFPAQKVIGSYEDKPTNCIFYFVWSADRRHLILEYNINTDSISTVYRDTSELNNGVLNFSEDVLITGINKIDDLLYWTCDNTWVDTNGVVRNNEPKYIHVEKAKAGWNAYYQGGAYGGDPSDFDIDTMYPLEFYTCSDDGSYPNVSNWRKLVYINVCKNRPQPPIYLYQTPVKNISPNSINLATLNVQGPPDEDGNTTTVDSEDLKPGEITYTNIGLSSLESTAEIDFAYKKNNLYGFMWQFAYRYVYKNNETSAYSDWSWVQPGPQYATNKVDESKQNAFNEVRVWYRNGPADVKSIELVARKCSFIETKPDEGNKGEFYLIATIDNYYYDPSYVEGSYTDNYTSLVGQIGTTWTATTKRNIPYVKFMNTATTAIDYSMIAGGYINFRNDGVYSQVDPVAFDKTYDQVPLRAKAQEIANENRIVYGNYVDGFNQVNPLYHLSPIYGPTEGVEQEYVTDPLSTAELGSSFGDGSLTEQEGGIWPWITGAFTGTSNSSEFAVPYTEDDGMTIEDVTDYSYSSCDDYVLEIWDGQKAFGWDTNMYKYKVKIIFPTVVESGQVFRLRMSMRHRHRTFGVYNEDAVIFPYGEDASEGPSHYRYDQFGFQLDITKQIGGGGLGVMVDEFIEDIKQMANFSQSSSGGGIDDMRGSSDPSSEFFNPNHAWGSNPQKIYTYWRRNSDGTQGFGYDTTVGASPMRLRLIKKINGTDAGESWGSQNIIYMEWSPYGQAASSLDAMGGDCMLEDGNKVRNITYQLPGGEFSGEVSNLHGWMGSSGDEVNSFKCTECTVWESIGGSSTNRGCAEGWGGYWQDEYAGNSTLGQGTGGGFEENVIDAFVDAGITAEAAENLQWFGVAYSKLAWRFWGAFGTPTIANNSSWSEITGLNMDRQDMINNTENVSAFKSGASHRFGLVYYDVYNRSSTVMLNNENTQDTVFDRNSSCYVGFPTERFYKQGPDDANFDTSSSFANYNPSGVSPTGVTLSDGEKLGPADIYWKIYHKPPEWAVAYSWVYARNTSVGKFMQFRISTAWVNKGSKKGTTPDEGEVDTKIYLSLDTMDGRDWSYSQKNRSMVGEWSFAEGDRIRLIADGNNVVYSNHYDLKVSDVAHFPDRFELGGPNMEETQVVSDSPVGGANENPQSAKPGKFVIIDDPGIPNLGVGDAENSSSEDTNGYISGWHKVVVEIYRPKKNTNEDLSLYYEFSEKYAILAPGQENRIHYGPLSWQNPGDYSTYLGEEVTLSQPAQGVFRRGDVWYKPRKVKYVGTGGIVNLPDMFCESYFLNDFMSTNHNNIGRPHVNSPYAKEQRRKATLTYSDVYQPDTQYNGLHSFNFSQRPYMDYDLSLGSIQKLVARDTNLVMMQENKISTILVNKDIITNPGGDQGLTLSKNVLPDNAEPMAGDYGVCLNPESVANHTSTIYFTDIKRGAVCRIGGDGITPISDYKMSDFFRDKMEAYQSILEGEYSLKLGGGLFIIGGFDPRHGEYVITFPNIFSYVPGVNAYQTALFSTNGINFNSASSNWESYDSNGFLVTNLDYDQSAVVLSSTGLYVNTVAVTLAFNERANRWTSFYTYYPEYYGTLNKTFISFKKGQLYMHDKDGTNHNMFYDNPFPAESKVSVVFNQDVSSVKTFTNLMVEGSPRKNVVPIITTSNTFDSATVAATTDSANLVGVNTDFTTNDIVAGDTVWYNDNGTFRQIGTVSSITNATTLVVTAAADVNSFISASSTASGDALDNVFIISKDETAYRADFKTNMNESYVTHRLSYNNDDANNVAPGTWVEREDVLSTDVGHGTTSSAGGEYFGLGMCSFSSTNDRILGVSDFSVSSSGTGTEILTSGAAPGDKVYWDDGGTITEIGTVDSVDNNAQLSLVANATSSQNNVFCFIIKNSRIEGDRLKGHYLETTLTKRTKDKIHMFAVNTNLINSELTNK